MQVTTFYSFKGGVGRTMALANVGVELAQTGRRVLLVDFDLEAPGLDTFDCLKGSEGTLGVVDFVNKYLANGEVPDVREFVDTCDGIGKDGGELMLMPAATRSLDYSQSFRIIDWMDLYEHHNGFLLFEDLKAQWNEFLRLDYVLIDSRTGHTDIAGICTRQLPDSVVLVFIPNEQNLDGLKKVVGDIESEEGREIGLHFVASNLPEFHDEDQVLEKLLEPFCDEIESFDGEPLIVHRYNSVALLNQVVFTKERPKARLSKEYRQLADEIVAGNFRERREALAYLQASRGKDNVPIEVLLDLLDRSGDISEYEKKLAEIERLHERDHEVLYQLGMVRQERGQVEQAEALFARIIEIDEEFADPTDAKVRLERARALRFLGREDEANKEAILALWTREPEIQRIRHILRFLAPSQFEQALMAPAIATLSSPNRIQLARELLSFESTSLREVALQLLKPFMEDGELVEKAGLEYEESQAGNEANTELSLAYDALFLACMATKDFDLALSHLWTRKGSFLDAFKHAMAVWGANGEPDEQAFSEAVALHESRDESTWPTGAEQLQCISLAYWATQEPTKSMEYARQAQGAIKPSGLTFSYWRFSDVSEAGFQADIEEMIQFYEGDDSIVPPFFR